MLLEIDQNNGSLHLQAVRYESFRCLPGTLNVLALIKYENDIQISLRALIYNHRLYF